MRSLMVGSSWLETIFWVCALFGSIFFLIRVVMMFIGTDSDMGDGTDDIIEADDVDSSDSAFDVISIHSITAFIMIFGWIGLTCYKQYSLKSYISILIAVCSGVVSMLITAYLFKAASKLVSEGDQFNIHELAGRQATVYQKIFGDSRGKIQVTVNGILRELDAVSEDKTDIDSFKNVEIISVVDGNTVKVKKI